MRAPLAEQGLSREKKSCVIDSLSIEKYRNNLRFKVNKNGN